MLASKISSPSGEILPVDLNEAVLVGRIWSEVAGGPCPVLVRAGRLFDLTGVAVTVSGLLEIDGIGEALAAMSQLPDLGNLDDILAGRGGRLLAPIDLQAIKRRPA
jgi:fumarylacetoacetate (FAA) hydrolase family protein